MSDSQAKPSLRCINRNALQETAFSIVDLHAPVTRKSAKDATRSIDRDSVGASKRVLITASVLRFTPLGGKVAYVDGSIVRQFPDGRSEVVVRQAGSWRYLTLRSPLRVAVQGAALILAGVLFNDRWLGAIRRIARLRWAPFRSRP